MTTVAVIQARTGSTRFPGKVLADLCGRPMLAHVIERVSLARTVDRVVVATTEEAEDDAVAALAGQCRVAVTRGPVDDVLSRFVLAATQQAADVVVRITADCPLVDPAVVDQVVEARALQGADYASNVEPATYPDGYDVEVFTVACLERLDHEAVLPHEREHVTARVREHPDEFRAVRVAWDRDLSSIRLTVDVPEDLERVAAVLAALPKAPPPNVAAVVAYLAGRPDLGRGQGLPERDERYRAQRDAARPQESSG
ncbi:MAG: glycosyltransferase family protein [Candidatus Dormibacteraeota bacterium]|uniref:Glycosyltransferase family protein n=1 Tax=Candidatus Aeolococcus gillhamiae TaxID=3127015 RepID=A0A2W5Z8R7_9BACT|nr:glycosyltransferase family protein [Candidatus Dormibacteraeota bacterium]PZR80407.1 MAG: spore coat protein [Candidatus Dormibacter sp. RRmetagenome_bin12]